MTAMTVNGVSTTRKPGQEQYETFMRKVGRKSKRFVQYDFRDHDGELFGCIRPTLAECRKARDAWVDAKTGRVDVS